MASIVRKVSRALGLAHVKAYFTELVCAAVMSPVLPGPIRPAALRLLGLKIGPDCLINSQGYFRIPNITMGRLCVIGHRCYFDGSGRLIIGDRVHIGADTKIITGTHSIAPSVYRRDRGDIVFRTTEIQRGCWIGVGCVILPGVTIAEGCVVAAGSVVVKDTAPNGLYAGSPAKRLKDLPVVTSLPLQDGKPVDA